MKRWAMLSRPWAGVFAGAVKAYALRQVPGLKQAEPSTKDLNTDSSSAFKSQGSRDKQCITTKDPNMAPFEKGKL